MLSHPLYREARSDFNHDPFWACFLGKRGILTVSIAGTDPPNWLETHTTSTSDILGPHRWAALIARVRGLSEPGCRSARIRIRPMHDAAHSVPRGLRLRGRDDDLLAHQRIGPASACQHWAGRLEAAGQAPTLDVTGAAIEVHQAQSRIEPRPRRCTDWSPSPDQIAKSRGRRRSALPR